MTMNKPQLLGTAVLFLLIFSVTGSAAAYTFDTFNSPALNVVSSLNELQDSGTVTSGSITYDTITGTGYFDLSADLGFIGVTQMHQVTITTNANGSLHLDGLVTFDLAASTDSHFFGDISVNYNYEQGTDLTTFTFSPIVFSNGDVKGLLMDSGPFAGSFLDFEVTSSLLAFVDNPYPVYAIVPVPATTWLFGSGLLGLVGLARR
jgi:hypothetical protein